MDDIYREELMEHYKYPQNRGHVHDATCETTQKNPMCGDVITMQLKIEGGSIKDIKFDGEMCAVSVASASVLTEEVLGKSLEDAKKVTKDELLDLLGVELTTSRIKCATLPLETLQNMIEGYDSE